MSLKDKHSRA